ncbi:MAG: CPXCG motif-containing cysteine-rich protein [Woeseiaceae bacterium]|nr:CPXCG motif-containing cysteine-rich protein [Woeseiaceae bacterium]
MLIPERRIDCPYCGEPVTILVDVSAGSQAYIEDCEVCCRPMNIDVVVDDAELVSVSASA